MDPARSSARQPRTAQPLQQLQDLRQSAQRLCGLLLSAILAIGLLGAPARVSAALPPGNAVTDPAAILRDSLPIEQNDLQEMQHPAGLEAVGMGGDSTHCMDQVA